MRNIEDFGLVVEHAEGYDFFSESEQAHKETNAVPSFHGFSGIKVVSCISVPGLALSESHRLCRVEANRGHDNGFFITIVPAVNVVVALPFVEASFIDDSVWAESGIRVECPKHKVENGPDTQETNLENEEESLDFLNLEKKTVLVNLSADSCVCDQMFVMEFDLCSSTHSHTVLTCHERLIKTRSSITTT